MGRADWIRRRRRLRPVIDELPDSNNGEDHDECRDQLSGAGGSRLPFIRAHTSRYSESVSMRSARLKSRSVSPPLLWVDRIKRTLL